MPGPDSAFISKPTKFEGIKVEAPKVSHSGKVDMTEDDGDIWLKGACIAQVK